MRGRVLLLSLVIALFISLCSVRASAQERLHYPVEGGNLYFDPTNGTVVDCDHAVTAAVIPAEIQGIPVRAIGDLAFDYCEKLHTVTFPDGLERIGDMSFAYCYGLSALAFPDSLLTIADRAFFDCTALAELSFGSGICSVGRDAFWGAAYLRRAENWDNDLLYAGDVLLKARSTLEGEAVLRPDTRLIAGSAFYGCTGLTRVTLPQSLTAIGPESFYYCISLERLYIPDRVLLIEESAFQHCAAIQTISIGSGVRSIGEKAFAFCGALEQVTIGSSLRTLGSYAFADCDRLTRVRFYGAAPELGLHVFDDDRPGGYVPISGLTLYFTPEAGGWTAPVWNGYPTALWNRPFADVPAFAWYAPAADYVLEQGLMQGVGEGCFAPESPMTRAMLVTVLWRYAGQPAEGTNSFTDVPSNVWYTQAVAWAAENGIVTGIGGGRFDPDGQITREQLAVILYRYCKSIGIDTSPSAELSAFPDAAKVSPYAAEALSWAVKTGLVTGSASGGKVYLEPQGKATRAQVATILMRWLETLL
ncbi:MAG: leucine-rich repeat protein [Oscillospiraceae bacterium]|nr:leucine-rich repeat protein [Oscillospiraceae bacterium]